MYLPVEHLLQHPGLHCAPGDAGEQVSDLSQTGAQVDEGVDHCINTTNLLNKRFSILFERI